MEPQSINVVWWLGKRDINLRHHTCLLTSKNAIIKTRLTKRPDVISPMFSIILDRVRQKDNNAVCEAKYSWRRDKESFLAGNSYLNGREGLANNNGQTA
ncbi:hypothetical protein NPIL_537011 [Nephila pilipes]|uniref:Uncharacterized protein n=1 Tax=Nephila pilipes TaxID=299642 RepID=A0A8X6N6H3_NEPPI|nr:hypothetical protein NPIL_537011 [Nephila pilipes]